VTYPLFSFGWFSALESFCLSIFVLIKQSGSGRKMKAELWVKLREEIVEKVLSRLDYNY
jgi:hypothetical protein